jgi:hypothetical protein
MKNDFLMVWTKITKEKSDRSGRSDERQNTVRYAHWFSLALIKLIA